jgi:WD40 repeat protein
MVAPPIVLAPGGQKFVYWDATLAVHVLTFGAPAPELVAASVPCPAPGGTAPVPVAEAFLSPDGKAVGAIAPIAGQCTSTGANESIHVFDVAPGTDHVLTSLADAGTQGAAIAAVSSGDAVAYTSVDTQQMLHVRSVASGDVVVHTTGANTQLHLAALSADTNRMVFEYYDAPSPSQPDSMYIWDRTAGLTLLASTFDNYAFGPVALLDPSSGIAIAYDEVSRTFVMARPGSAPTTWSDGNPSTYRLGPSGNVFGVTSTDAGLDRLYAVSFPSGAATTFTEVGDLLAPTDTSVYFVGPDGVCLGPVP